MKVDVALVAAALRYLDVVGVDMGASLAQTAYKERQKHFKAEIDRYFGAEHLVEFKSHSMQFRRNLSDEEANRDIAVRTYAESVLTIFSNAAVSTGHRETVA